MLAALSTNELFQGLLFFLILVSSLCVHEWGHAWTAWKLGDDTAQREGRVTLDPLKHIDLIGTVILPLACIFLLGGKFFLAWAKPVPVNTSNFQNPVRGDLLTTFAGPATHLVISLTAAILGGLVARFNPDVVGLAAAIIEINIFLFVFNMLPIPPLDGGRILRALTGMSWETFARVSQMSPLLLLGVIWFVPMFGRALLLSVAIIAEPFARLLTSLSGSA